MEEEVTAVFDSSHCHILDSSFDIKVCHLINFDFFMFLYIDPSGLSQPLRHFFYPCFCVSSEQHLRHICITKSLCPTQRYRCRNLISHV